LLQVNELTHCCGNPVASQWWKHSSDLLTVADSIQEVVFMLKLMPFRDPKRNFKKGYIEMVFTLLYI
jgi:hypothetical protein